MYESQSEWNNAKAMYQKALEIQPDIRWPQTIWHT